MRRWTGPLIALTLAGVAAAPALATSPVKGGRYTGTTSQGFAVSGRVTSDGRFLQMTYRDRARCSDGSTLRGTASYQRQAPGIRADGTIDYRKRYANLPADDVFKQGNKQTQRVTGAFKNGGRTVKIKVVQTTTGYGTGLTCEGTVTFTLRLKG